MVDRHLRFGPGARIGRAAEATESLPDHRLHVGGFKVADRNDRHQIGPVPVLVEALQHLGGSGFQDSGITDRKPLGVVRSVKDHGKLLVLDPGLGTPPAPPFLDDHAALLVYLFGIEEEGARPVHEDLECGRQHLGVVHRDPKHVHGLVEARVGVDVRPELHPDRLEVVHERLLLEVLRAVEGHVFNEMRQPELVFVLEDRARVDGQAQFGTVLGLVVLVDEEGEPVVESAGDDFGVGGDGGVQIRRLGRGAVGPDKHCGAQKR